MDDRVGYVRVAYTVEVTDSLRRAIRAFYGKQGLASRAEVVDWFKDYGSSMNDDLSVLLSTLED